MAMANALEIDTIVEGVETEAELEALRQMKCSAYQGFVHSEAVLAEQFQQHLAASE